MKPSLPPIRFDAGRFVHTDLLTQIQHLCIALNADQHKIFLKWYMENFLTKPTEQKSEDIESPYYKDPMTLEEERRYRQIKLRAKAREANPYGWTLLDNSSSSSDESNTESCDTHSQSSTNTIITRL